MTKRRSGWVVLFAVVAAVLGGAFAVRARKKRKQPAPPEPKPRPAVKVVPPPTPDYERALLRMALGSAVFIALALVALVLTMPRDDAMIPGTRAQTLSDDGARVKITVVPAGAYPSPGLDPSQQNVVFYVTMRNTGHRWVGARLGRDAWVVDTTGASYVADQMSGGSDGQLYPGGQSDQVVAFAVPRGVRLIGLHLAITMPNGTRPVTLSL